MEAFTVISTVIFDLVFGFILRFLNKKYNKEKVSLFKKPELIQK
jgi:hypothetical protein